MLKNIVDARNRQSFVSAIEDINQKKPIVVEFEDQNVWAGILAGFAAVKQVKIDLISKKNEPRTRMGWGMAMIEPMANLFGIRREKLTNLVVKKKIRRRDSLFPKLAQIEGEYYFSGALPGYDENLGYDQTQLLEDYVNFVEEVKRLSGYDPIDPHVPTTEKKLAGELFRGINKSHLWKKFFQAMWIGLSTKTLRLEPNLIENLGSAVGYMIDSLMIIKAKLGVVAVMTIDCTGVGIEIGEALAQNKKVLLLIGKNADPNIAEHSALLQKLFPDLIKISTYEKLAKDGSIKTSEYLKAL